MSDSRRHWKESIGVIPRRRDSAKKAEERAAPQNEHDTAPQPAGSHDTAPQAESRGTSVRRERVLPKAAPARPAGEQVRAEDRQKTALTPMERILDSLPSGSMDFSRQVRAKLWPDASPDDLRRLSLIVEGRTGMSGRERSAAVKAVVLSQRCRNLPGGNDEVRLDPTMLRVHGNEWRRIVEVAQGIARHVRAVLGELDGEAVVGRAVQAGDEALHDEACHQVETAQTRGGLRVEVVGEVRRSCRRRRGVHAASPSTGTCSSRRRARAAASRP